MPEGRIGDQSEKDWEYLECQVEVRRIVGVERSRRTGRQQHHVPLLSKWKDLNFDVESNHPGGTAWAAEDERSFAGNDDEVRFP
jgi:hypothetical protein